MVINVSWGVGLGIILHNELYRGNNGFAGEFSHIPVFNNNKICTCGKIGCLETETSLSVLIDNAKQSISSGNTSVMDMKKLSSKDCEDAFESIKTAAGKGDRLAIELFSEIGYNIGRGVAILIHLLNPALVALSGRGALAGKIWQASIQQAVNEHCIPILAEHITIAISPNGYEQELIGGAALVMENIIQP
jgi:predicted NBD/HSP70 family sugar kinase